MFCIRCIKKNPLCRLASTCNTTDSTAICSSPFEIDGNLHANAYDAAYGSSDGMNTIINANTELPSTSTSINYIDSVQMTGTNEAKRPKLNHKFDIDDTCSNDAFVFNSCLKGNPLKSNQKTTTAPCTGPK